PPKVKGDEHRGVFNLPVERFAESNDNMFRQIVVERVLDREILDEEDVMYRISAETKVDNLVNLEEEFETWVDTYGYVTIEDVGTIRLNPTDVVTAKNHMDISIDNDPLQLLWEEPKVVDNMLFIYNGAETRDSYYHTKSADIHLFYDMEDGEIAHPFTDRDFTIPMMKGKEFALGIDDNYYLFGYDPAATIPDPNPLTDFFDETKLKLTRVNGVENIVMSSSTNEVVFTLVSGQKVKVNFETEDLEDKEVLITLEEPEEVKVITEFDPSSEFYEELPEWTQLHEKILTVGRNEYYNCDTSDTKDFQRYMLLCKKGSTVPVQLNLNEPKREADYLMTYRGRYGSKKIVTFQKILGDLSYVGSEIVGLNWADLKDNLTQNKMPVISIDNKYYDLAGGSFFDELKLLDIATTSALSIDEYYVSEGNNKGMINLNGSLLSFEQSLTNYQVTLNLRKEGFKLVTVDGFIAQAMDEFISTIGGDVYTVNFENKRDRLKVILEDNDGKQFFVRTMPISSQTVLLPNKDIINVEVIEEDGLQVRLSAN
ncbi:MAG: hypothetical protein ABIH82_01690, partial [Candidatus Woesearchaeota archaeon]